jgi:putative ABC transport system permease protein
MWRFGSLEILWQDLRYGVRLLFKTPGLTAVAVLALAFGIGANTMIFSVVNALLLRPLPYEKPEQLMVLWENHPEIGLNKNEASPANFIDWREQTNVFEQLGAFQYELLNLTSGSGEPEAILGASVTSNLLPLLGVKPALGRTFTSDEGQPGGNPVLVATHDLWRRRFASDPSVVGKTLILSGKSYTLVGVMPKGFQFYILSSRGFKLPVSIDCFTPLVIDGQMASLRGVHDFNVIGRLKEGITVKQAQRELDVISARLQQQYPDTNNGRKVRIVPLKDELFGNISLIILMLLAAVGFVLLIACANVSSLLLARASARQKEMSIRMALGAGRLRLIRQLLTESVLLAMLGGGVGIFIASSTIDGLIAMSPSNIPRLETVSIDREVLGVTFFISLMTALVFGLVPALQLSKPTFNEALKEGGRSHSSGAASHRMLDLLVVSEVALALVLLVGAGLMIRSFIRLLNVDPGFNPKNVLTGWFYLPPTKYESQTKLISFHDQLLERVRNLPGVRSVSVTSDLPLGGTGMTMGFYIEGQPAPLPGHLPEANYHMISPSYFDVMGISLVKGQAFTEQDNKDAPGVVIINQALANRYWPNENALGKRISFGGLAGPWLSVIGITLDIKNRELDVNPEAEIYAPYKQAPGPLLILTVRTVTEPLGLVRAIQNEVSQVDKGQPVFGIKTMEQHLSASVAARRFAMLLLGVFAGLALLLATIGIYGVVSYFVILRTSEFGIRMALGATASTVLKLVVIKGMKLVLLGVGIGLILAFALTRVIVSLLYGISSIDIVTFIMAPLLLVGVAFLASAVPARRATQIDPLIALRQQ